MSIKQFISTGLALLLCLAYPCVYGAGDDNHIAAYKLYFTRHAEKVLSEDRDPPLTASGVLRAENLATFLIDKNISAVYSTDYKRTQQTAGPTAQKLKLAVTSYDPADLPSLIEKLKSSRQNALVVGHSNTTPMAVYLAGGRASSIDEAEYGRLFEVSIGGSTGTTTIHNIDPHDPFEAAALRFDFKRIQNGKARLRMLYGDREVGFAEHEFSYHDRQLNIKEITVIEGMGINAVVSVRTDANLNPLEIKMSGSMGSPVNISLTFAGNRVEGYSDIDREAYYPQGKMEMSTSLPIATYLRSAVLLAVPGIGYSSGDQSIYWFSSYDGEVKQIKISKTGETSVTVPAGTFDVDIVSVSGGTPSQLYYINKLSPEVIKIEIPGTPWSYEKVVSP